MSAQRIQSQHGFTLLELLIAMTIGLLLTFGLIRVFASSSEAYQALSQASQQIENGRYAIQVIGDDLRHAGYYGEYGFAPAAGTVLPEPCELNTLADIRAAINFHVQGYNNVAAGTSPISTCLASANIQANTDILVVRRAHTSVTAIGLLPANANEIYLQATADSTNSANPVVNFGSAAPGAFSLTKKDAVTPAEIRKYHVHIYFISPCSVPAAGTTCTAAADGGRPIPTLKRLTLTVEGAGNRVWRNEVLAEGIENLQIEYGIDTNNDGLPDGNFVAVPGAVEDWSNVMTAQLFVLARTPEMTVGGADTKTYVLNSTGAPGVSPGGNFRRHLFTSQVRIVTPAGRREVP